MTTVRQCTPAEYVVSLNSVLTRLIREPVILERVEMPMSSIAVEVEGTWVECGLEDCKMMFKRHKKGHRAYTVGDEIGICPMCYFKKKVENGTLIKRNSSIFEFHHKSTDSKPEKDSL